MMTASPVPHALCRLACMLLAAASLASCNTDGSSTGSPHGSAERRPAVATYRCGGGGKIVVETAGARVRVTEAIPDPKQPDVAQRDPVELMASPPDQRNRYGLDGYALVIEGREALWMRARATPKTCTL